MLISNLLFAHSQGQVGNSSKTVWWSQVFDISFSPKENVAGECYWFIHQRQLALSKCKFQTLSSCSIQSWDIQLKYPPGLRNYQNRHHHGAYSAHRVEDAWGFAGHFLHKEHHRSSWESLEVALDPERRSMGTSEGHLITSRGLINHGWVAWPRVSDVERPETLNDPRLHYWWCVQVFIRRWIS